MYLLWKKKWYLQHNWDDGNTLKRSLSLKLSSSVISKVSYKMASYEVLREMLILESQMLFGFGLGFFGMGLQT